MKKLCYNESNFIKRKDETMITKALLEVSMEGLGNNGVTSIFPCGIFRKGFAAIGLIFPCRSISPPSLP